ncbi:hypothetical protein [Litoreibacter janthinus]|uniref:Uncharacterized protein n=1 Tax=Litoreibacter janthinus TaxID=670154 RepID=A0A1I6HWB4_9RHOB|nr:hypothetical protein [Litoreibacter janthinus]SFR58719.1 hypothetical protein SAMN04488002_3515 [Litoreibacter janthinus]
MFTSRILCSLSGESLVVALSRELAGAYRVRSVEVETDDMRKSYAFRSYRAIESVFVPRFADCLTELLQGQTDQTRSVQLPGFAFSGAGVGLSGLRIQPVIEGGEPRGITLFFKRYIGDAGQLLNFEASTELTPAAVRERIAVEVLSDIVTPIFDMMSLTEPSSKGILMDHGDEIEARLQKLAEQRKEIQFYTGLLQRYVAGCQEDAAKQAQAEPDARLSPECNRATLVD